jgi:hypothetical protein
MAVGKLKFVQTYGTAPGTTVDCNRNPNYLSKDGYDSDYASFPIAKPEEGETNYSYEYKVQAECEVAPDNEITDPRMWGPDVPPATDVHVYVGTESSYTTPVNTQSSIATTRQDTNCYGSSNYMSVGVIPGDNKIDAVGEKTHFIVHQLRVMSDAPIGNIAAQYYWLEYDES